MELIQLNPLSENELPKEVRLVRDFLRKEKNNEVRNYVRREEKLEYY